MPRTYVVLGAAASVFPTERQTRETWDIDTDTTRAFITHWFAAVDQRDANTLAGMCTRDVVIRPNRARQEAAAPEYAGHGGVHQWVATLDSVARITLELCEVNAVSPGCAVVTTEVWQSHDGFRRGGLTYSVWRFDDGKLREAVGYSTRDEALEAAGVYA